ncbi:unnamed protein product [Blepharisma stoltei]|uniref:Uncharacterized protein n=1 Tax=Blepharisma stoltei TaxID=1481888 RepID=A0AAU9K2C9_9CILI|nr:unnamed protein product [Blepharisma stoltei]
MTQNLKSTGIERFCYKIQVHFLKILHLDASLIQIVAEYKDTKFETLPRYYDIFQGRAIIEQPLTFIINKQEPENGWINFFIVEKQAKLPVKLGKCELKLPEKITNQETFRRLEIPIEECSDKSAKLSITTCVQMLSHTHSSSFSSEDYSKKIDEINLLVSDIVIEDDYLVKREYFRPKEIVTSDNKKADEPAHVPKINEKENLPEFEKSLERIEVVKPIESNFILVGDSPLLSPKKALGSRNLAWKSKKVEIGLNRSQNYSPIQAKLERRLRGYSDDDIKYKYQGDSESSSSDEEPIDITNVLTNTRMPKRTMSETKPNTNTKEEEIEIKEIQAELRGKARLGYCSKCIII